MKKWLFFIIVILTVALIAAIAQVRHTEEKWKNAVANVKAYSSELSTEKEKSTAYRFTIDQLSYFKDSLLIELDSVRKELKVKDKNLKALQAIYSKYSRIDTITFTDTLFLSPTLDMDTSIVDKWYKLNINLKYPSTIAVAPTFLSRKYIVVSSKKETVNPPKKFFLLRWFQKKHWVLNIDVVEQNPYIQEQTSRYIEIIK